MKNNLFSLTYIKELTHLFTNEKKLFSLTYINELTHLFTNEKQPFFLFLEGISVLCGSTFVHVLPTFPSATEPGNGA